MAAVDLSSMETVVRIMCGAWLVPHTISKLTARGERRAEIVGFFSAAGLRPAGPLIALSAAIEVVSALGMILGVLPRYAAGLAAAYLAVAAVSVFRVSKARWIWFNRGAEYTALYAALCLVVAIYS